MSRSQKTGKNNRETYIYYDVAGKRTEIIPGVDGVTNGDIHLLHEMDDLEFNNNRRHETGQLRFDTLNNQTDGEFQTEISEPADPRDSQLEQLIQLENTRQVLESLYHLQPQQLDLIIDVYYRGRKIIDIAREQGVSHVAILDRLKRIHRKIEKFLEQTLT